MERTALALASFLVVALFGCAPPEPGQRPALPVSSFVAAGELLLGDNGMASDVADFDGDGVLDLGVGHSSAYSLVSMVGAKLDLISRGEAPLESYFRVAAVDLDADGHVDLLASDSSGLWLLRNDGRGALVKDRAVAPGFFPCFSVGDFNADGLADVLAGGVPEVSDGGASVVELAGRASAERLGSPRPLAPAPDGVSEVLLRDLTGDGVADLVVGSYLSSVTLARGRPSGQFEAPVVLGGDIPDRAVAGDVDGDGVDDLLIANRYTPPLLVSATGAGIRSRHVNVLEAGGNARIADLDLDGAGEVFSAFLRNPNTQELDSVVSAARRVDGPAGEAYERVATVSASGVLVDFQVADFTGDGRVDIAALFIGTPRAGTLLRLWRGEE